MSKSALEIWNGVIQRLSANSKQQEAEQKKVLRGLLPQYQREVRDRSRMPDATLLGQFMHHAQQSMMGTAPLTNEWGAFAEADRKEIMRRMSSAAQQNTRATTMERTVGTTKPQAARTNDAAGRVSRGRTGRAAAPVRHGR